MWRMGAAKARPYGALIVKKLFELSNRQLFELFFIIALEGVVFVVFVVFKTGGGRMPFVKLERISGCCVYS